jgi:hypothetical protein
MFGITAFTVLTSTVVGGVLAREGALEGEQVRERRGCQDEDPTSRLLGGDLALRFYYLGVLGIDVCFVCFSFMISSKSIVTVAILGMYIATA